MEEARWLSDRSYELPMSRSGFLLLLHQEKAWERFSTPTNKMLH